MPEISCMSHRTCAWATALRRFKGRSISPYALKLAAFVVSIALAGSVVWQGMCALLSSSADHDLELRQRASQDRFHEYIKDGRALFADGLFIDSLEKFRLAQIQSHTSHLSDNVEAADDYQTATAWSAAAEIHAADWTTRPNLKHHLYLWELAKISKRKTSVTAGSDYCAALSELERCGLPLRGTKAPSQIELLEQIYSSFPESDRLGRPSQMHIWYGEFLIIDLEQAHRWEETIPVSLSLLRTLQQQGNAPGCQLLQFHLGLAHLKCHTQAGHERHRLQAITYFNESLKTAADWQKNCLPTDWQNYPLLVARIAAVSQLASKVPPYLECLRKKAKAGAQRSVSAQASLTYLDEL